MGVGRMTGIEKHLMAERNHHTEIVGCTVCVSGQQRNNPDCWKNLHIGDLFPDRFCNFQRRKDIPVPSEARHG